MSRLTMEIDGKEFRPKWFAVGQEKGGKRRWHVMLRSDEGLVVETEESFATREEAYAYGMGWIEERGGEVAQ